MDFLPCLLPGSCSASFFYIAQAHLPKDGTARSGLSLLNQPAIRQWPKEMFIGHSDQGISLIKAPSSQVTQFLSCW